VYRLALVLLAIILFAYPVVTQQATPPKQSGYAAIPVEVAKQANPVKSSPESLARAKKWWTLDCEMCHGKTGDGKGETAQDMKLAMMDFTNPETLKGRTDGELYYIIKNGHNDMPAEGPRVKPEEAWDLVNYIRSLVKNNKEAESKGQ